MQSINAEWSGGRAGVEQRSGGLSIRVMRLVAHTTRPADNPPVPRSECRAHRWWTVSHRVQSGILILRLFGLDACGGGCLPGARTGRGRGWWDRRCSAARAMLRGTPPKDDRVERARPRSSMPGRPDRAGRRWPVVWYRLPPAGPGSMRIPEPGVPGSRISARRRSSRPQSSCSTRQKWSASSTCRCRGSFRPRRRPAPPAGRSSRPRTNQASGK